MAWLTCPTNSPSEAANDAMLSLVPPDPDSNAATLAATLAAPPISGDLDDATLAGESAAGSPEPPDTGEVAPQIGKFSILRKLGEGGMGIVYAGYDDELDRKVAIKLLRGMAGSERRRQRLIREAQGLARLSHPNVVQVYEIGEHEGAAFIAMEYVDGQTLESWLATPRSRAEILATFIAAGRGLAAAHSKGLVHRDFKPDNVMVTHEGRVLVMDFGLVHEAGGDDQIAARMQTLDSADVSLERSLRVSALSTDLTATGSIMGTPAYMSAEQFGGKPTDARTDQFSFCVALWEALCGERPFAGETFVELCLAVTTGELQAPPRRAALPGYLRKILERGLASDVERRWPAMEPLLIELGKNRTRRRRIAAAVVTPLVVALALTKGVQLEREAARERALAACEVESRDGVASIWNDERAAEIARVFAATELGFAPEVWTRAAARLDTYATEWAELRTQACRAEHVEIAPPFGDVATRERIVACLDDRRAALGSLIEILREADRELVPHAVDAAAGLPLLSPCVDAAALALEMQPPTEQRAEIDALRVRLGRVRLLLAAARNQVARDEARAVLDEAEVLAWPPLEAEARYAVGLADNSLGAYEAAASELERAFFIAGDAGHDLVALRAASALIGIVGNRLERAALGFHWAALTEMFIVRLGLVASIEDALLANARGNLLSNESQLDDSLAAYRRARELWSAVLGPEHPAVGTALNNIGIVQRKQGALTDALASMDEALRIRETTLGDEHPQVGDTLYNLGNVRRQLGELDEALALLERAVNIWKAALGPGHHRIAVGFNNIANIHFARGELDEALALYDQARSISEQVFGPDHSDVANAVNNIGNIHYIRGDHEQALPAYQRALAIWEQLHGAEHPSVALALSNVAMVHQACGDHQQALALHTRVLAILVANHGPEHPDVAQVHFNLGTLHHLRGELGTAERELSRALELLEQAEVDPLALAEVEFELARVLWVRARRERARELALAARRHAAGSVDALAQVDAWLNERGLLEAP
jgi:eukaryotic-like serine/threonine-protein kinase